MLRTKEYKFYWTVTKDATESKTYRFKSLNIHVKTC